MRSNILLSLFILCYLLPSFIQTFQVTYDVSKTDPTQSISEIHGLRPKPKCNFYDDKNQKLLGNYEGLYSFANVQLCDSHNSEIQQKNSKPTIWKTDSDSINSIQDENREKREIESFDNDDYPSAVSNDDQEEPGFWDKIVKVALKLFSRFIEWLNSS